ncbi:MAG: ERCC4 domain-containing protein, partial [Mariprofundaceae bacterium]|nr:ERCC4 domain-containing protein [Mariprofundaceae bacterium]
MNKEVDHGAGMNPTTQTPIRIVVDDREARCGILEMLNAMESFDVRVGRLTCGDFEVGDKLLFERKTLTDLAISIKDGRVFRQGCRLAQTNRRGIIILEGSGSDLASSDMRREALQGALISLAVFLGIPLLRSRNLQETAYLMLYTARQSRAITRGALPRPGVRPRGKRKTQLHILQGLPGVGPERAHTLLDSFGSIEAVLTASVEELAMIKGIGTHTAASIQWAVHESDSAYGSSVDP